MEAEFAREILSRLPLAEAVLSLWRWVADPLFLLAVFARHRGQGYEKEISFGVLVQVMADALLEHQGSGKKSFARAREEGLRQGALNLTEALERERQRIGMDLHDQTLADLTRLVRRLEKLGTQESLNAGDLGPLLQALQISIKDLRQIIEQASPSILQLFGFAEAVENHLERSIAESGTSIEPDLHDESGGVIDRMDQTVRIALFRIVQEAIKNAVQHAGAANIGVRIECRSGRAWVSVSDDGKMEKPTRPRIGGGIGNMNTRARLIAATLTVGPNPKGKGTLVRVSLPCSDVPPAMAPPQSRATEET
jgi:signal transduction histidine kinase